jgi:two-component system, NarL family, nitrate/nitrite response regulator NarL
VESDWQFRALICVLRLKELGRLTLLIQKGRRMLKTVQISLLGKNEIAREGLRKILSGENFHIRNSASDVAAIAASLGCSTNECDAHVIIVDDSHTNDGLETCRALGAIKAGARLVLLADHYAFEDVAEAFQAGVDAVIIKEISCEPLIESIRLVALGEKVFPSQLANNLTNCTSSTSNGDWRASAVAVGLSDREMEILEAIMAGMANKVIARQFDICEATVKVHVKAILRKLGVDNRTQAATWAVKHGVGTTVGSPAMEGNPSPAAAQLLPIMGRAA